MLRILNDDYGEDDEFFFTVQERIFIIGSALLDPLLEFPFKSRTPRQQESTQKLQVQTLLNNVLQWW